MYKVLFKLFKGWQATERRYTRMEEWYLTTKEELSQYKFILKRVNETLQEYEEYKLRAEKMTAIISDNPSHSNKVSDKVGDNASKMADLEKEYQNKWLDAERMRLDLVDNINKIDEPYRTLLMARYIQDKTLEQISVDMNYSYEYIRHLHGEALQKYEERQKITHYNIT